jgi:hypothetical protein
MELDTAALNTTTRDELLDHWRVLIGKPPPKHISRGLLIQILAWEQQSKHHGGLNKRLSQRLNSAALRDVLRPAFKPGSRFVREYRGATHIIEVDADGRLFGTIRALSLCRMSRAPSQVTTSQASSSLE